MRFQDDSDCTRPEAKIFNVSLEPCIIHPPPITDEDRMAAQAAKEAVEAEVAAELAAAEAAAAEAAAMAEAMAAAAKKKKGGAGGAKTATESKGATTRAGGSGRKGSKAEALARGSKGGGAVSQRPSTSGTERSDGAEEQAEKVGRQGAGGRVCCSIEGAGQAGR